MTKIETKLAEIDYLDQTLARVSMNRLREISKEIGMTDDLKGFTANEILVFNESWARTLAQTLR